MSPNLREPRGLHSFLPLGALLPLGSLFTFGLLGCLSPRSDQDIAPTQDITQAVEALVSTIKNNQSTITNDVWPWVVMIGLLALIPVAGFLVWYWIKSYSYLTQKPKYEILRRAINGDNNGDASLPSGSVTYQGDSSHSGYIQESRLRPDRGVPVH